MHVFIFPKLTSEKCGMHSALIPKQKIVVVISKSPVRPCINADVLRGFLESIGKPRAS